MLIMHEEGIRGGICQATYRYAKAKNKYMKNDDRNIESSFLEYLDANNLCGWPMCKKLPEVILNGQMTYQYLLKTS